MKNDSRSRQRRQTIFIVILTVVVIVATCLWIFFNDIKQCNNIEDQQKGSQNNPLISENGESVYIYILETHNSNAEATLIKYGDFEILIDGGSTNDSEDLEELLDNYVTDGILEMLIVTNSYSSHLGSLRKESALKNITKIDYIFDYGYKTTTVASQEYEKTRDEYIEKGSNYFPIYEVINNKEILSKYFITKNISIEFLNTNLYQKNGEYVENVNFDIGNGSIACVFTHRNIKYFLGSDIGHVAENNIMTNHRFLFTASDRVIYKTSNQGKISSNSQAFLNFINPECIFITGTIEKENTIEGNYFKQDPSKELINRLLTKTETIFWLGTTGTLQVESIGTRLKEITGFGRRNNYYTTSGKLVDVNLERNQALILTEWYTNYLKD